MEIGSFGPRTGPVPTRILDGVTRSSATDVHRGPGLVEFGRAECLRLLATSDVGRVVFSLFALPAAHPVSYLLDGEEIVFRLESGSAVLAAVRDLVVAFQVDEIDRPARTGWSVLAIGEPYEVVEPARRAALVRRLPQPWAPDPAGHVLSLPAQRLTGRRIGPI